MNRIDKIIALRSRRREARQVNEFLSRTFYARGIVYAKAEIAYMCQLLRLPGCDVLCDSRIYVAAADGSELSEEDRWWCQRKSSECGKKLMPFYYTTLETDEDGNDYEVRRAKWCAVHEDGTPVNPQWVPAE